MVAFADPCIALEIAVAIVDKWPTIASKSQNKYWFIAWCTVRHHLIAMVNQRLGLSPANCANGILAEQTYLKYFSCLFYIYLYMF